MVSIRQLLKELKEAQAEEGELNLQSEGQEGTHKVEEAQARLNKARDERAAEEAIEKEEDKERAR